MEVAGSDWSGLVRRIVDRLALRVGPAKAGFVYVIQGPDGTPFKVGFTASTVEARLASLQTGNPYKLRIVDSVRASEFVERAIHQQLSAYRMHGEWFAADGMPRLREIVANLRDDSCDDLEPDTGDDWCDCRYCRNEVVA